MALLSYRATPLPWCGLSPAELLMGRRLQTDIPQPKRVFIPDWPYLADFCEKDEKQKRQQKAEYDRRHRARPLPPLPNDETVWVRTQERQVPGRVIQPTTTPRSYIVETPSGIVCRNQSHLSPRPGEGQSESVSTEPQQRTIAAPLPHHCRTIATPLPHDRRQELTLVLPPDSRTGKGEMWHTGSHYLNIAN